MKPGNIAIVNAAQLVTCRGFKAKAGPEMNDLGIIEDGAVIIKKGWIDALGPSESLQKELKQFEGMVIDAGGHAVLPGFVDPHTHFVFNGYRADEFALRLQGAAYLEILARGGGILNTVEKTRQASHDVLIEDGRKRLDAMLSFGVTTVEGKSGYGLNLATEMKQLEVMQSLNKMHPVDVARTFLGAHAVPAEYKDHPDKYVDFVCDRMMPFIAESDLAEFCDVFCDKGVFTLKQAERILKKALDLGLKLKIHADEMEASGGSGLAARLGAVSADHLLHATSSEIRRMAQAGVVATLLPATAFNLREPYADARAIVTADCPVALATDFNPGSSFTYSISLIFALATLMMQMSIEEALTAVTINAAAAIDRAESIGSIDVGKKGDLVVLEFPSYTFLPYHTGVNAVRSVIKNGCLVIEKGKRIY